MKVTIYGSIFKYKKFMSKYSAKVICLLAVGSGKIGYKIKNIRFTKFKTLHIDGDKFRKNKDKNIFTNGIFRE